MKICTVCLNVVEDENTICCNKKLTPVIRISTGTVFIGNDEPDWQYVKFYYVNEDIPHTNTKKKG